MKNLSAKVLLLASAFAGATVSHAQLITFDALASNNAQIASPYANLQWTNFFTVGGNTLPGTGYDVGTISAANVAFNGYGADASFSAASSFTLSSLYLTGAWSDNLNIRIRGLTGGTSGTVLFDQTFIVNSSAASFLHLNYAGVDAVTFSSFGGFDADATDGGQGTQFALDNLLLNDDCPLPISDAATPVPEPSTYGLIGAALLAGVAAWKRRRKA